MFNSLSGIIGQLATVKVKLKPKSKSEQGLCQAKGCFNKRHTGLHGVQRRYCRECQTKANRRAGKNRLERKRNEDKSSI